MRRFVVPVISVVLFLTILGLILKATIFNNNASGLQISSIPSATIYLDGREVGKTPYEDTKLVAGEKIVKLVPDSNSASLSSWEAKIKLTGGTLSLIRREFGESENSSQGEIVTLEKITDKKNASLIIISQPDASVVKIDGQASGFTPVFIEKIAGGEHEITLSSSGFVDRKVKTKLVNGFKTTINVDLAENFVDKTEEATPASSLGKTVPTVIPNSKVKVTGSPSSGTVKILDTPTGWLRVRIEPSTIASEAARVNPGEAYPLLEERSGWFKISYETGKEGWISSQYAQKQ